MTSITAVSSSRGKHCGRKQLFLEISAEGFPNRAEIESCFKPHIDEIVEVAKAQVNSLAGRSKVLFCSGGFGCNDYLLQRRELGFRCFLTEKRHLNNSTLRITWCRDPAARRQDCVGHCEFSAIVNHLLQGVENCILRGNKIWDVPSR